MSAILRASPVTLRPPITPEALPLHESGAAEQASKLPELPVDWDENSLPPDLQMLLKAWRKSQASESET